VSLFESGSILLGNHAPPRVLLNRVVAYTGFCFFWSGFTSVGVPPTSVGLRLVYLCPSLHAEGSLGIKPRRDVNMAVHGGDAAILVVQCCL